MIADADSSLARSDHIASTSSGSHESKLTSSIVAEPQVAETVTNHNDEDSRQVNQERSRLKRKQSLEAQVTSGCGGGKKKARIIDSFYGTLWPILERIGWKLVSNIRVIDSINCTEGQSLLFSLSSCYLVSFR
jgi:hypothetical protein